MAITQKCWTCYAVMGFMATCAIVFCPSSTSSPTITSFSTLTPYEEPIKPETRKRVLPALFGGMANVCTDNAIFPVSDPWRLRWRVQQITNSTSDNRIMAIELLYPDDLTTFRQVDHNPELSEFKLQLFVALGKTFCLLARISGDRYTLHVQQPGGLFQRHADSLQPVR